MSGSVSTWIKQVAEGDDAAVGRLQTRFWDRIGNRAKYMIRKMGLLSYDYEDIRQHVFSDLVVGIMSGQAEDVINRRVFWRMLDRMTYTYTIDLTRIEEAKKRPRFGEPVDLDDLASDAYRLRMVIQFEEELERISLEVDQAAKSIIDMLRQGFAIEEIAAHFDVSPRTIHRKLVAIKDVVHSRMND